MLASELWQYIINNAITIDSEIVDLCVKKIIKAKSDYYYELFDRQTKNAKNLLVALSKEEGTEITSMHYLKKHGLSSASSIQKTAVELLENSVIEKTNGIYSIADPFFKKYINDIMGM
jgi:hypothetical protein